MNVGGISAHYFYSELQAAQKVAKSDKQNESL